MFGSPRQALAHLYAHHRGPRLARPRYDDAPPSTGRSHWDGSLIGSLLYGPRELGGCGLEPGGQLDLELRAWATTAGQATTRTPEIRSVERRMRDLLRAHGLMGPRTRAPAVRHWTDPDGLTWASAREPLTPWPKGAQASVASDTCASSSATPA